MQASKVSQLVPSFPFSCSHHQQYLLLTHDELREEGGLQKQRFPPLNTLLVSNVLSAPVFLECCSAPAPCQKKECHSHFTPSNKKEWNSSLALSKKSALFLSLFLKERKIYLTKNFFAMYICSNLVI